MSKWARRRRYRVRKFWRGNRHLAVAQGMIYYLNGKISWEDLTQACNPYDVDVIGEWL